MLISRQVLDGIAAGRISLAFRRWQRPTVRAGGRLLTAVGVLAIEAVDGIEPAQLTAGDARRAGHASLAALLAAVDRRSEGVLYRIRLRHAGPDPRLALRSRRPGTAGEVDRLRRRLERLDAASSTGPWTGRTLHAIAAAPGLRATELVAGVGIDTARFKLNVRKLKELGLTISLQPGYRLSPRGCAFLRAIDRATSGPPRARRRS